MDALDVLEADALRAFAVFARHRNFTSAAAELRLSQPSLHVKIRNLGRRLDQTLYERVGRTLVLTADGQRLAAFAQDSRRRASGFLADSAAPAQVSVATGRGALRWVISDAIRLAGEGGTPVSLVVAERAGVLDALSAGTADLGFLAHDRPPAALQSRQVARYSQVVMLDRTHPLAGRARVSLRDLDGLDLVLPPPGRPHRDALDRAMLDVGISCQVRAVVDGWDMLTHLAHLGFGATIVNGCVPAPPGMSAVAISDLPTVRYWAVWRPARHRAAQAFLQHVRTS